MIRARTFLLGLGLLATFAVPAAAHEEGVIHLGSEEVAVGSELTLTGEHLPENATLRLELQGALGTIALAEVRTDSVGGYHGVVALPAAGGPGSYTVVAIAADGDVVARADLVVRPAAAASAAATAPAEAAPPVATAAMMELPVRRGAIEWIGVVAFVVAAVVAGSALLRSASRA